MDLACRMKLIVLHGLIKTVGGKNIHLVAYTVVDSGLSLRFQVPGHMKLVGVVPSGVKLQAATPPPRKF